MSMSIRVLLVALLFTISPMLASAQRTVQHPKIGVFEVGVDEPQPKMELLGQPITFKLKEQARFPKTFHVRIFRGTPLDLMSTRKHPPDAKGCVKYSTAVMQVYAKGIIRIRSLDSPAWLRFTGSKLEPEDYTLVFESGDEPSDSTIWLHKFGLATYFKYGVTMRLLPSEDLQTAVTSAAADEVKTTLARGANDFASVTRSECWTAHPIPQEELALNRDRERLMVATLTPTGCVGDGVGPLGARPPDQELAAGQM